MATTYQLISSVTVGSGGASSIDFTSIPATYTDLLFKLSIRSTVGTADNIVLNINSKGAGTGITMKTLYGTGSASGTSNGDPMVAPGSTATASVFGNGEIYFPNYTSSSNKSYSADTVMENNNTTSYVFLNAFLWSYTETISSVKMTLTAGNLVQYSTAYLYGIKNS